MDITRLLLSENSNTRVFIGIGTNVGDRSNYIDRALDELRLEDQIWIEAVSSIYETVPVGLQDQPNFLNGIIRIKTAVHPLNLLEILKRIEVQVGRQYRKRWGPREIDLDILIYGDLILDHPLLRIPHPEMLNRQFVLQPLVEIQPDLIHPSCNQTISQIVCHMATEIETVSWEKKNSDSRQ